jgi:hypothetical protein
MFKPRKSAFKVEKSLRCRVCPAGRIEEDRNLCVGTEPVAGGIHLATMLIIFLLGWPLEPTFRTSLGVFTNI